VPDGSYVGSYDAGMVAATVQVDVQGGRLVDVVLLEHKTDRGKPAEAVVPQMLSQQSLVVDTVSGATNSSKVIMAAAQDAVRNAAA